MAALISSYEADFSSLTVRSTTETSTVGTRNAMPVNLPFKAGSTFPTAYNTQSKTINFHMYSAWKMELKNESRAHWGEQTENTKLSVYLGSTSAAGNDVEASSPSTSPVLGRGSINSFLSSWTRNKMQYPQ